MKLFQGVVIQEPSPKPTFFQEKSKAGEHPVLGREVSNIEHEDGRKSVPAVQSNTGSSAGCDGAARMT